MSDTMNDDVSSRFRAIWVGLLALLSFGILSAAVVAKTSKDPSATDPVTELRAMKRSLTVAEVEAAQDELVSTAAKDDAAGTVRLPVDEAAKLVTPQLKSRKAAASQTVIPGSPTQIKQSQQSAPAEAEPDPNEPAPTAPKPAAKPETTAPKPAPAKPAAKPETTAPKPAPAKPAAKPETTAPKPAPAKPAAKPETAAPKPAPAKPAAKPETTAPKPAPAAPKPAAPKPAAPKPAAPAPAPATAN